MSDRSKRYSTQGRPRSVTDAQIAAILAWHTTKRTNRQKAAELGISLEVLAYVIRTQGQGYKQPSPEGRNTNLNAHRSHVADLRARYLL
jgi:hypothetical protein